MSASTARLWSVIFGRQELSLEDVLSVTSQRRMMPDVSPVTKVWESKGDQEMDWEKVA